MYTFRDAFIVKLWCMSSTLGERSNKGVVGLILLDLCQRWHCLAMRQGGILFCILEFIAHTIMMRQVFLNVFVLFGNIE
mgnify:CR=1 FL=1